MQALKFNFIEKLNTFKYSNFKMDLSMKKNTLLNEAGLILFENKIATCFNNAEIKAPIHLSHGNEKELLDIFNSITEKDWICCSWRCHYHCLLKGVPEEELTSKILLGKSISLNFPEYKIFSSAIVTGIVPISVGIALGIKLKGLKNERVFCFIGDMTSESGVVYESIKYSINYKLPVVFIVEDNTKSVCTDTRRVWGLHKLTYEDINTEYVKYYKYFSKYPHAGAGVRVQF